MGSKRGRKTGTGINWKPRFKLKGYDRLLSFPLSIPNVKLQEDYQSLSSGDYEMLYSHLLREYRELCRAHQLLQARCGKTHPQGRSLVNLKVGI